mmetsp:Transcript_87920/g.138797  ORF Transcript_87920/g.138797 Transcript_87920/m.138797 type:complete len:208 (-) Transcript_87920:52-675(-)
MGGLKNRNKKQARNELKKTLKCRERCPHCKKMVTDLDVHLKCEHSFSCARCGKRFAGETQWKQHMKDLHGLNANAAVKDDKHKKLERWLNRANTFDPTLDIGDASEEGGGPEMMESDDRPDMQAAQSYRVVCEACGAEAFLPVNLSAMGLTFQCSQIGRSCGSAGNSSSGFRQSPLAAGFSVMPTPAISHSFGTALNTAVPSDDEDL